MSSGDKQPFQSSVEPLSLRDLGQDQYGLDGSGNLGYISEKQFVNYPRDVELGGEYGNFAGFNKLSGAYGGRYRRESNYYPQETEYDYEYAEPRTPRSRVGRYLDILRQTSSTPDSVILDRLPPIGTDYQFVLDRRPPGHEDDYISAREYTTYFANWQIPIAAPGHMLHSHDTLHSTSYAKVFSIPEFAEMVNTAAGNALLLPDDEGSAEFTNAMDKLGDMLIIDSFSSFGDNLFNNTDYVLRNARRHLQRLVSLYFKSPSEEPPKLGGDETGVFDMLWRKLGFDLKEAMYGTNNLSLLSKYIKIERNEPAAQAPDGGFRVRYNQLTTRKGYLAGNYDLSALRSSVESSQDF